MLYTRIYFLIALLCPITTLLASEQNGIDPNYKANPKNEQLWDNAYCAPNSQYRYGSTGSCTINALECTLRLQKGEQPSIEMIEEILKIACEYKSNQHTGIDDTLPTKPRYKDNLKTLNDKWMQPHVRDINLVLDKMKEIVDKGPKSSVSVVITKPPESIFLHMSKENGQYLITLYDSHPRPEKGLYGSHMLQFHTLEKCEKYLRILFPFFNLAEAGDDRLEIQQMNYAECSFLQLKEDPNPILGSNVNKEPNVLTTDKLNLKRLMTENEEIFRKIDNYRTFSTLNLYRINRTKEEKFLENLTLDQQQRLSEKVKIYTSYNKKLKRIETDFSRNYNRYCNESIDIQAKIRQLLSQEPFTISNEDNQRQQNSSSQEPIVPKREQRQQKPLQQHQDQPSPSTIKIGPFLVLGILVIGLFYASMEEDDDEDEYFQLW